MPITATSSYAGAPAFVPAAGAVAAANLAVPAAGAVAAAPAYDDSAAADARARRINWRAAPADGFAGAAPTATVPGTPDSLDAYLPQQSVATLDAYLSHPSEA